MVERHSIENNLISLVSVNDDPSIVILEEKDEIIQKKIKQAKQRITVQVSAQVIERIKNAVYWTPGLTLAALEEKAFSQIVDQLEEERGLSFPQRKEQLKTGRPIN